jgi:proteasome lid subunit RPN8/RPN11
MILIEPKAKNLIVDDAIKTYPDECCGFLFGVEDPEENRTVTRILSVDNAKEGDKRKRFLISSRDYLGAENFAFENNLNLLGVYHSHPDHPAIPSEQDRAAAQPYFSYVIVSVRSDGISNIQSWKLNDEFQFEEEQVSDYQFT